MSGRRGRIRAFLRKAMHLYRSRAFILGTMVALTVLYGLGVLIPQRVRLSPGAYEAWRQSQPTLVAVLEGLGLTDAFRAPITLFVTALFFVSLIAVLSQRLPALLRHTRLDQGTSLNPRSLARRPGVRRFRSEDPRQAIGRIRARLAAEGYATFDPGPEAVRGVRFRFAPVGFLLFHASFGLILVGAILLDQTRFSVTVPVAVGESFSTREGPFTELPRLPRAGIEAIPEVAFRVISVEPESTDNRPTDLAAELLLAGESQPSRLRVNEPLVRGSTSILIMNMGPTALFVCETREGQEDGAYVKLGPYRSNEGRFHLEACGLEILARPDLPSAPGPSQESGAMIGSLGMGADIAVLPEAIEIAVRRGEEEPTRGVLRTGEAVVGPDAAWSLRLEELRYYGDFQIIDERGGGLLILGFVLGVIGLIARLVFYRREIVAVASGEEILVFGTADGAGLDRRGELVDALAEGPTERGAHAPD